MLKHSIVLGKLKTSISLEEVFWAELKAIAKRDGRKMPELIGEIKAGITDGCGLSSALRCYVLNDVMVECARWGGRPGGQDARTKFIDC